MHEHVLVKKCFLQAVGIRSTIFANRFLFYCALRIVVSLAKSALVLILTLSIFNRIYVI